ncbi:hypothetical protein [Luteibacter sp.]|uniref:hypothetical protein n=1 Tax=Luteibacter sp. TaxID=1886636 RepID=UPI0025C6AEF6|nr:hypothetical protein [Luteibacter sp.]
MRYHLNEPAQGGLGQVTKPFHHEDLPLLRRARLGVILDELRREGASSIGAQALSLGIHPFDLAEIIEGADIDDRMARDIEWAMNLRHGWLDDESSL